MSEYLNIITPKGRAVWPAVVKPDSKYNNFKTGLTLTEEEGDDLLAKLKEHFVDNYGPKKLAKAFMPIKKDEESGGYVLTAKSKDKPKLSDRKGNLVKGSPNVGGGSLMKLDVAFKVYDRDGKAGVTAYLNAVQLLEVKEFSRNGFKEEEGSFEADDADDEADAAAADATTADEVEDDDIPF